MTLSLRQRILKTAYPLLMRAGKLAGSRSRVLANKTAARPLQPLYGLSVTLNNGAVLPLSSLQGKKLLLVNTASDCGYTAQYHELQQLYEQHNDKLVVIGFPANDFKEQEKRDDAAIAQFCQRHFGVRFPLARKSVVTKGRDQNPMFYWLSHQEANGWNDQAPEWNFSKYLVNEAGVLTHYFGPAVSPLDPAVISALLEQDQ